jgi:ligand-binding sensor domain-containing protein
MKFSIRGARGVLFFCLLFILSPAEASQAKKLFSFQHFTTKDGLSSEMVYAIAVQGDEVWLGTYGGGVTLWNRAKKTSTVYTTKGEPQEKDDGVSIKWKNHPAYNDVWVILPEQDRIWFGTYFYGFGGGGISYYKPGRKNPWRAFNTNQGRAKKVVSLAATREELWVGSEKGLSLLDKKTEKWAAFISAGEGLAGNFVNSLLLDQNYLWIATNAGINRMNLKDRSLKTYGAEAGLVEMEVKSLVLVKDRIWAGSPRGALLTYDAGKDAWSPLEAADPLKDGGINSMHVFKDSVWICRDNGVSRHHLSGGRWEAITAADGLLSNTVFSASEDRDGVWFGTDQGASRLILNP